MLLYIYTQVYYKPREVTVNVTALLCGESRYNINRQMRHRFEETFFYFHHFCLENAGLMHLKAFQTMQ